MRNLETLLIILPHQTSQMGQMRKLNNSATTAKPPNYDNWERCATHRKVSTLDISTYMAGKLGRETQI